MVLVADVVTPLIGIERGRVIVEWWAAQGSAFVCIWAGFAFAVGLFLAYTAPARRPRSDRLQQ